MLKVACDVRRVAALATVLNVWRQYLRRGARPAGLHAVMPKSRLRMAVDGDDPADSIGLSATKGSRIGRRHEDLFPIERHHLTASAVASAACRPRTAAHPIRQPMSPSKARALGHRSSLAPAVGGRHSESGRRIRQFVTRRPSFVLATLTLAAVLVTAGCASTTRQPGTGMMSGADGSSSASMMGGSHYSQLTCRAPASLPGRLVTVTLADMEMTQMMRGTAPLGEHMRLQSSPHTVAAGTVNLVAQNMGWRTHELVILPLDAGATAGHRVPGLDGKVSENGSLGEASASCAPGVGEGVMARTTGWITLTLAPGRYELVCNLANHYADGMWTELTVT